MVSTKTARPPLRRPAKLFYGWWVAGAVALGAFSQVAFFNPVLGAFFSPLEEEFGWSRAAITGGLSLGTVAGAVAAPFIGPYLDRYGGRWFMTVGIGVMTLCLLLLGLVQDIWQFYALYIVGRALVTAVTTIALTVTVANWFIRDRGRASAVMLSGQRIGGAVMPLLAIILIETSGWRTAYVVLGFLIAVLGVVPSWFFIRRRPEDVGLRPDGVPPEAERAPGDPVRVAAFDPHWTVRQAARTPAFWLLLFGTSQLTFAGGAVNLSLLPHMEENGIDRSIAGIIVTTWALTGIAGGIAGGELRHRLSSRVAFPITMVVSASGLAWFIVVQNVWMGFVFAAWHGFAFGSLIALNQVIYPDYFGRFTVGALRGMTAPVQFGLNAVGPLAASILFDIRGSYDLIFAGFVGCYLAGAVAILFARVPRHPG